MCQSRQRIRMSPTTLQGYFVPLANTIHDFPLRRIGPVSQFNFMMYLRRHASSDTTKDHIGHHVDTMCQGVISLTLGTSSDTGQTKTTNLQTIGTTNQLNIIVIQSQSIRVPNDMRRGTDGGSRTQCRFQTHTGTRTGRFTQLTGLETATTTKISLTTFIVGPTTARIDMIQGLVSHVNLRRTETNHGSQPTAGLMAGCLTQRNVKLGSIL
jgi:hypothetical protein